VLCLGYDAWSDLDFLPEVKDTGKDQATGDTSFKSLTSALDLLTSKDQIMMRRESEVKSWIGMGDVIDGVLVDSVNVGFQLGKYGHDGWQLCKDA
jgi:hypothetical protein